MSLLEKIIQNKIVAVIRNSNEHNIIPILQSLFEGGVKAVEITAETENVTKIIETAVNHFEGKMLIGAGTVIDPETAKTVISAGAQFIVSPTLNIETLKLTNRYGLLNIPGVLTPTEILTAYENGAQIVKIFPGTIFDPGYIKNVLGPLPFVKAMVTGGITLDNINEYLSNGYVAVGIGSSLVNVNNLKSENDYNQLRQVAKQFVTKLD
ncbi:bifunctional 4-hydroxy-2-oxoglutarate aldolase/2-dehydro-3-deoxy-phosphogluconate aldolase [Caldifermentibacillus hisashii]|uniref:bifunctional 4-hydroxy-2-oxoglutarate aldolase/2-dehydro-3-deoxy-phosphogluconate aldolase n=1 Tax=Caldifermentibacillus hisashii TaxID=996558 RepID=UPI0031FBD344